MKREFLSITLSWVLLLLPYPTLAQENTLTPLDQNLLAAAKKGDTELVNTLLAKDADVNARDSEGAEIVFGTIEPEDQFPWVVRVSGTLTCHGVLVAPRWVLTAAHCVSTVVAAGASVGYTRRGIFSGWQETGQSSVYVHPAYTLNPLRYDIALVRLRAPLAPDSEPLLQPAELPVLPPAVGQQGTVANLVDHTTNIPAPAGTNVVYRGAISTVGIYAEFDVRSLMSALCTGDSGSGFITTASSRRFVSGIASASSNIPACDAPNIPFEAASVYGNLNWIDSIAHLLPPPPIKTGQLLEPFPLGPGLRVHKLTPVPRGAWAYGFQDVDNGYGNSNLAYWKVADVNGDGRGDLVEPYFLGAGSGLRVHKLLSKADGTWTYNFQDVNAGYNNSNLANWKVADVNGDGRGDLVEPYFLGAGSGLRVHKLLSNADGTWTYNFQDVNAGYNNSNLANWKVADVNGDGRDDLVEVYFRGPELGLRIHTILSTISGSWTFSYQDVNSGYNNSNLANWKVADVDADGKYDLAEPYYLGAGSGLRVHTIRSTSTYSTASWVFSYADVNSGYGNANLTNWKVADVNGDGCSDLVEPYYLGAGLGLRVHRLLSLRSGCLGGGPSSAWSYNFQDINSGYTNSNLSNWKVMDADGDGYADLIEPYFLGAGSGLRVHTARSLPDGTWSFSYWDADAGYGNRNLANWKVAGPKFDFTQ